MHCLWHLVPSCWARCPRHSWLAHQQASPSRGPGWDRSTDGPLQRWTGQRRTLCHGCSPVPPSPWHPRTTGACRDMVCSEEGFQSACSQEGGLSQRTSALILGCAQAAPDGRGPPSSYRHHLPPPPSQGEPALQMSPVPGPPAPQGPGEGDGKKQAVRLVWLVTNTAGLLPACPPCGPRGACGLLAPALPALCPAHPCIPASSHLSPSLGSVLQGWEIRRRGTSEAPARLSGAWWGAGSKRRE